MTIKDVAQETHLDWKTVKELDKQYMREQVPRIGTPAPKVIGVDKIAIRKGHTYHIVVSDLLRRRLAARTPRQDGATGEDSDSGSWAVYDTPPLGLETAA
jgi:hypothetical protein